MVQPEDHSTDNSALDPGPYVVLSVTDTGEGMDEGTMDHIFDPFFTTKPKGKGTGLGLSTVYGIVKQSGGYVWAESEPGCGTTFRVFLPRTEADIATDRVPGKNSSTEYGTRRRTGSGTVLVVEDERAVREFIVRVLTRAGYVTLEATHGTEALELSAAHEGTIDLLLTDVVMPGIGGSELARAIRRSRSAIRVLLMSGYTEDESIRASAGHSRQPFLEKPFSADDLLRVVSDILESASGQQRGQPG